MTQQVARIVAVGMMLVAATAGAQAKPAKAAPAAGATAPAAPPAAGGTRVAVVNIRALLQASPMYAAAESTMAKEADGYRAEIQKMQAALDTAAQALEQQSVVLSPTQRNQKRAELEAQQRKIQERGQELQQKAQQRERDLMAPIQTKIIQLIEGARKDGGYGLVLDAGLVVSGDIGLDITQRVLDKLKAGGN